MNSDQKTIDYLQSLLPDIVKSKLDNSNWIRMTAGQSGDYCFRVKLINEDIASSLDRKKIEFYQLMDEFF